MNLQIDWVAAAILGVALVVSQIRSIPLPARYGFISAACLVVGFLRLRGGRTDANLAFAGIAAVFAVVYGVRALRARAR
jgi:hypothetical protein